MSTEYFAVSYAALPATDTQPVRHQSLWMTRVQTGEVDGEPQFSETGPVTVTFSDLAGNMGNSYEISEDGETRTGAQILAEFGIEEPAE
jgi:hypothetical protein